MGIDHHWNDNQFGESVSIWDETRSTILHNYKWGADSILSAKFNPTESCLLASTGSDRGVSNEDNNVFGFDMRNLDKALMIYKDNVSAVMDVAYSPTGKELVSSGYDRMVCICIFKVDHGRSRDIYHIKRMQRVFYVNYSSYSQYVLSGSDDTNIYTIAKSNQKSEIIEPYSKNISEESWMIENGIVVNKICNYCPKERRLF
eukprot:gene6857-9391_t